MNPIDIKAGLAHKGYSLQRLAKEMKVTRGAISRVVNRKARSVDIEMAISELLEKEIYDVFPDRYRLMKS